MMLDFLMNLKSGESKSVKMMSLVVVCAGLIQTEILLMQVIKIALSSLLFAVKNCQRKLCDVSPREGMRRQNTSSALARSPERAWPDSKLV